MSGEQRGPEIPQDPPWSLDRLADLHAGVLEDTEAEALREQVAADAEAMRILRALDATSADLAEAPPMTIPDDVAADIDAALARESESRAATTGEQQPSASPPPVPASSVSEDDNVVDLAARRRRRWSWGGAGVIAAAAAATGVLVLSPLLTGTDSDNQAGEPPGSAQQPPQQDGPPPMAVRASPDGAVTLDKDQFSEAMGSQQYLGALTDPERLVGCLRANGVRDGNPLGAREITMDGESAQLFILSTGQLAQFRLLTVGPECGPGNPATISDSTFGG